jgi:hypothetical protein
MPQSHAKVYTHVVFSITLHFLTKRILIVACCVELPGSQNHLALPRAMALTIN